MYIINRGQIVREKIIRLQNGYSAYVETFELAQKLKQEISILNLNVYEDKTEFGFWFIPLSGSE
ncbi:hypothetical protein GJU40_06070 [Bacillus lacus]|uniref:Uncharacterized protein n=1 Tax=Metabacillus lacus TaxID=1983721 RepID=A0A7X2IXZ8_9BACI|nr:hypothetical protein [Metabacillus lacus]MRX71741.1 hypothetical protein [Metabacillus lacus]